MPAEQDPAPADLGPDAEAVHAGPPSGSRRARASSRRRGTWAELPALVVIAFLTALLLKTFVVQAYYIPSSSMEPTLQVGDRVLVSKLAHLAREPERGEVVVFTERAPAGAADERGALASGLQVLASGLGLSTGPERDFIKRIIGLPGDVIEVRDGVVLIDGEPLPESVAAEGGYLTGGDTADFGPVVVEADHYFMLGDNRANSADSRYGLGQIHRDQIVGRAFVTVWPVSTAGGLAVGEYASSAAGR